MSERRFKVGDRVLITGDDDPIDNWNGKTGKIIDVGIKFGAVSYDYDLELSPDGKSAYFNDNMLTSAPLPDPSTSNTFTRPYYDLIEEGQTLFEIDDILHLCQLIDSQKATIDDQRRELDARKAILDDNVTHFEAVLPGRGNSWYVGKPMREEIERLRQHHQGLRARLNLLITEYDAALEQHDNAKLIDVVNRLSAFTVAYAEYIRFIVPQGYSPADV